MFTLCSLLSSRSFKDTKTCVQVIPWTSKKGFNFVQNLIFLKQKTCVCLCFFLFSVSLTFHHPKPTTTNQHHHFSTHPNPNHLLTMATRTNKPTQTTNHRSVRSNQPSDTPRSRCHRRICATEESHQLHRRWHTHGHPNGRSTWWHRQSSPKNPSNVWVCLMMVPLGYQVSIHPSPYRAKIGRCWYRSLFHQMFACFLFDYKKLRWAKCKNSIENLT